jgi:hypothetical protein
MTRFAQSIDVQETRRSSTARQCVVALLLVLGVQIWLVYGKGYWGSTRQVEVAAAAFLMAAIGPVRRAVFTVIEGLDSPNPVTRRWITLAVAVVAPVILYSQAVHLKRDFQPRIEDEFAYIISARQLAIGRLWMPRHPLADFFESTHLIVDRVYASRYYPGTAMVLLPAVWLGLPLWTAMLACSGVAAGLLYRVTAELVDGAVGLLAALMLVSLEIVGLASITMLAYIPALALGLVMIWAWLCWRRERSWVWAIVIGAATGWEFLIRMQDVLCFALPLGVAILIELYRASPRRWRATILGGCLGITPFFAMALICDKGVTGKWFTPPYVYYAHLYEPRFGLNYTSGMSPMQMPPGLQVQKQIFARGLDAAFMEHASGNIFQWIQDRVTQLLAMGLPHTLFYLLVPVGMMGATLRRGGIVVLTSVVWVLMYAGHFWLYELYDIPALPGIILLVLLGIETLRSTWPVARAYLTVALYGAIVGLSVMNWPQFNRISQSLPLLFMYDPVLSDVTRTVNALPEQPAIVLFKFDPSWGVMFEPEYNDAVAWPDNAPIIRAHDLGPERDWELYDYYASRQPLRAVYRYNLKDRSIVYLGRVGELAAAHGSGR